MSSDAPFLEVANGPLKGTQYRLLAETITIGRSPECDVVLDSAKGVSRRHAQIMAVGDKVRIRDLDSQNGIYVEGKKVGDAVLASGCKIKIGDTGFIFYDPANGGVPAVNGRKPGSVRTSAVGSAMAGGLDAVGGGSVDNYNDESFDAESVMMAAGQSSGRFLSLMILLAVLIGGGLYLVSVLIKGSSITRESQYIMNKGEDRIIAIKIRFDKTDTTSSEKDGRSVVSVESYRGALKKVLERINKLHRGRGLPAFEFLVVKALARGDGNIILKDSSGNVLKSLDVMVRGMSEREQEDKLTPAEAKDLVERLLRDAERYRSDGYGYSAMKAYVEAEDVCRDVLGDGDRVIEIQDLYRDIKLEIKTELESLFDKAMIAAFPPPDSSNRSSFREAYELLQDGKNMVPDRENHDWQVLNFWQMEIERINRRMRR